MVAVSLQKGQILSLPVSNSVWGYLSCFSSCTAVTSAHLVTFFKVLVSALSCRLSTFEDPFLILGVGGPAAGGRLQKLLKFEEDPMDGPTILQQNGEEALHHLLSPYSIKYQMVI